MGNYIFNTEFLFEQLKKDAENEGSGRDFGHDIIPAIIEEHNVFAFPFRDPQQEGQPYWRDVGTLDSFWEANMELVMPEPQLDLYDPAWPIWTYQEQLPPAKFIFDDDDRRGMALDSTVSGGCIISGSAVRKSLLFSNVHVRSFCEIEQSVILPGAIINRGCKIKRAIIDRSCEIPAGLEIGFDRKTDEENGFRVSKKGIVLVTRDMLSELAKKLERQTQENKKLA
jgi:glucose-1-phosphate adenylyltransferase